MAEKAAGERPDSYDARVCLGLAYQKSHRVEEALACYDAVLRAGSDDADLHNNRGIALQESGRLEEAFASYERALELRPDFPLARFHRGAETSRVERVIVGHSLFNGRLCHTFFE